MKRTSVKETSPKPEDKPTLTRKATTLDELSLNPFEEEIIQNNSLQREPSFLVKAMQPKIESDIAKLKELIVDLDTFKLHYNKIGDIMENFNDTCMTLDKNCDQYCTLLDKCGLAEPTIQVLKHCNTIGFDFEKDRAIGFDVGLKTLLMAWNATCEGPFGGSLTEAGLIQQTHHFITTDDFITKIQTNPLASITMATLNIYQNAVRRVPDVKYLYHEHKILEKCQSMQQKIHASNGFIAVLYMIYAHLMTEEQLAKMTETGTIGYIIYAINTTLSNEDKKFYVNGAYVNMNFVAAEFAHTLCALSVSEQNKYVIVQKKGLPVLLKLLKGDVIEEQVLAAKTLWNMAFDEKSRKSIIEEEGLVEALEKLQNEAKDATVRKMAKGAFYKIKAIAPTIGAKTSLNHIMISYNHAHQATVSKVKDTLIQAGFKVWMDIDQMSGSTLDAMATAIEQASVVLICASELYKQSPSCRTEGEYAFQLKKPVIPLMLQRHYRPDGWLGMLMGSKLYINFDGKFDFEHAFKMLRNEIAKVLKPAINEVEPEIIPEVSAPLIGLPPPKTPPKKSAQFTDWTKDKVAKWIQESQLQCLENELKEYDGHMLKVLLDMTNNTPEFIYKELAKRHSLVNIVKLKSELDKLS